MTKLPAYTAKHFRSDEYGLHYCNVYADGQHVGNACITEDDINGGWMLAGDSLDCWADSDLLRHLDEPCLLPRINAILSAAEQATETHLHG